MHPTVPAHVRRPVWAGMLAAAVCVLAVDCGRAAEPQLDDDNAKSADANQTELHLLKNDDLLKRAGEIYEKAAQDYRAAARALAAAEILLQDATEQAHAPAETQTAASPPRDSAGNGPTAEVKAQAAVDKAKAKQAAARERSKLVQARKELLAVVSTRVDAAQSAGDDFLQALDDLKPYTIEIGLRVKDGSLAAAKIPPELSPDALAKKRNDLAADQAKRKQKVADAPKAQDTVTEQLDEAKTHVLAADAEVARAAKTLAQENRRLEMENAHARKSRDGMLAELARLLEEGNGLRGNYELAVTRFTGQSVKVDSLRETLNALKQPEVARAEDVEVAAKSSQELIDFYSAQTGAVESLRDALILLAEYGEYFEANAEASREHLFKMNVLSKLLLKAGVSEDKFPDGGQPSRVAAVDDRVGKKIVEVKTATDQVKTELTALRRNLAEAKHAGEAEAKNLANLKKSQTDTTAALKWEEQIRGMTVDQIKERFSEIKQELDVMRQTLVADQAAYDRVAGDVTEARAKLDELKDPNLREAEAQRQSERLRIASVLRKEAGLDDSTEDAPSAEQDDPEGNKKNGREIEPAPDKRTDQEKITVTLANFQYLLTARVQILNEREDTTKELLAALDNLQMKAEAYNGSLGETRKLALQLNTAALDLMTRLGKGELSGDKMPDGVTDALRVELRTKLESDTTDVVAALEQIGQEREKLRRPDSEADVFKALTKELLEPVGKRLDRLAELKKLTAEYERDEKDRSPADVKRLDQVAADRRAADGTAADWLLGIDPSEKAKSLEELLEAYYRELIEIEEKNANLTSQEDKVNQLLELADSESETVAKALPLLKEVVARIQAEQEEEFVVARARLQPDRAVELLQDFQNTTGQWLPTPVPFGDEERAEQIDKIAAVLSERFVQRKAAERWGEVLAARLEPTGIKAETGHYRNALASLEATAGAKARRLAVLTDIEPSETGEAVAADAAKRRVVGGEIGKTRKVLTAARTDGVKTIGIKIAAILFAAFLLPHVLMWPLRRALGGDTGLVLSALTTFLKTGLWMIALALVLSVLGFDVTAIVAGLGIGGLAIGLAAQPMIADMIAALVIFAEGKFKIGEVIKLGNSEPAKVVGLAWRSTQLRNTLGLVAHIPNRQVTEQTVQNLTKGGKIFDILEVTVTTQREVSNVLAVIKKALEECRYLTADHGVSVREFTQKGETKVVKYRFWWFVEEYEGRDKTRDEVFNRISRSLDEEDLKETEVTLA